MLKAFSLFVVLLFKYFTGLNLGAKRIARLIKSIYQASGGIKKLFKHKKKRKLLLEVIKSKEKRRHG
jgi:hypothetical protein